MNEKIKELAEQAGLYDFVIETMGIDLEMQQFAQLIVRECANVAADHDALDIYEEIREHFGIEQ